MNNKNVLLTNIIVLFFCGIIPVLISYILRDKPQNRYIHIENFRYGKEPSAIYCNRGDTLHLTFSSRDTGHSFFLEEFDIDVKVNPSDNRVLQFQASNPSLPPLIKKEVILVAEYPGIYNYFISKSNFRCHVWCGPMHAFEHGKLIIEPNILLHFGLGLLLGIFIIGLQRNPYSTRNSSYSIGSQPGSETDIFKKFSFLKTITKKNWFQPVLMTLAAIFLYIILLITLFGTQMSGRNLGVILIWTFWIFLLVAIFTPFGGRAWCTICPLPILGEFLQRRSITRVRTGSTNGYRNTFYGLNLTWPEKLNNGWLRLFFFLITGTLSITFVIIPRATGIAILVLFVLATLMALIWKLRSFCQYICPINTFIGLYSKLGKLALRKSDSEICARCKPLFCEKGSSSGWACPYGINVRDIDTNFDCGLCTECVKSCSYDNVTFRWRKFGSEFNIESPSMAWASMALFVFGTAYTILYLGHWSSVRDFVNIFDKGNWDLFAIYVIVLWLSALVIFPLSIFLISKGFSKLQVKKFDVMISSTGALLPLGLFIWIAFTLQMLFTNITFLGQSLSDPFGWGWNLLGLAGTPWKQLLPQFIPWFQVLFIVIGFYYSIRNLWYIWLKYTVDKRVAFKGMLPLATYLWIISAVYIWFYSN
jgi:polyferredoxin